MTCGTRIGAAALTALAAAGLASASPAHGKSVSEVAAGPAGVWWADTALSQLWRLDRPARPVPLPQVTARVAVGRGALWATTFEVPGRLVRVDLATRRVTATPVPGASRSSEAALAVSRRAVWVTRPERGDVLRFDAATGRLSGRVPVGRGPTDVVAGHGAVWVANWRDATVSRIDEGSGRVTATVAVGHHPRELAVAADGVWLLSQVDRTALRIDPAGLGVTARVALGDRPGALTAGPGGVHVSFTGGPGPSVVRRVDGAGGPGPAVGAPVSVTGMAAHGDVLWLDGFVVEGGSGHPAVARLDASGRGVVVAPGRR